MPVHRIASLGIGRTFQNLAMFRTMSVERNVMVGAHCRQMAYWTGRRIVEMVHEDLRPSKILTRKAFENAIVAASALGASTNCPPHVTAIARHMGVPLEIGDRVRVDLGKRSANILIGDDELARRRAAWQPPKLVSQTPWQELQRRHVTQLQEGACLDFAINYQRIDATFGVPRDNH